MLAGGISPWRIATRIPRSREAKALTWKESSRSLTNRRSSIRVNIDLMPVEIFGQGSNGKVFREETHTTVVNAHGAHLILTSSTEVKTSILLINKKTNMEVQCRVVYRKETEKGKAELGLEFVDPQPRFWGIAFPPEDWNNADRKRPAAATPDIIIFSRRTANGRKTNQSNLMSQPRLQRKCRPLCAASTGGNGGFGHRLCWSCCF